MNKKFLSAVLFGALLASTTGTFTSCCFGCFVYYKFLMDSGGLL